MNNAYRTLLNVVATLVIFAGLSAAILFIDSRFLTYCFANLMVLIDLVLGSWLILPPFLSWTLLGFVAGTFFYLSVIEGHRFNSRAIRVGLLLAPTVVLVLSPLVWARVELRYGSQLTFQDAGQRRPGEEMRVGPFWFVWVPPGRFRMGSVEEEPGRGADEAAHIVTISNGFWLSKYEVTQRQWQDVMENNPSRFAGCDACPVENVAPGDCGKFISQLFTITQRRYRLPTEAEWEYAARAGTQTPWASGADEAELGAHAWYAGNSGDKTHPVGEKEANKWGLHDMHGNVREWCADRYGEYLPARQIDPLGPAEGELYVMRGGGWASPAADCRSARRATYREGYFQPRDDIGLRLVYVDAPPPLPAPEPEEQAPANEGPREGRVGFMQRVRERNEAVGTAADGAVPVPERGSAGEAVRGMLRAPAGQTAP